jgi:hypothetical protein
MENLSNMIGAIKKAKHEECPYENWVYECASTVSRLFAILSASEKLRNAKEYYIFNLEKPSEIIRLVKSHIEHMEDVWKESKDWKLDHHTKLLDRVGGCTVICVINTTIQSA